MPIVAGQQALASDVLELTFRNKLLSHTRDGEAASGDVAYTGYGFQPKALIIFASHGTTRQSWGFGDVNLAEMSIYDNAGTLGVSTSTLVSAAISFQYAVLNTLDADGFTLTWTKVGGGIGGNITLVVLALGQEAI